MITITSECAAKDAHHIDSSLLVLLISLHNTPLPPLSLLYSSSQASPLTFLIISYPFQMSLPRRPSSQSFRQVASAHIGAAGPHVTPGRCGVHDPMAEAAGILHAGQCTHSLSIMLKTKIKTNIKGT